MAANAGEDIDPDDLPWPDPVTDIGEVLDAAVAEIARYLVADATTYDTMALWSCGVHLLPRADLGIDIAPRLAFQSPTPRCGKSTALELTACMSPRAKIFSSISTASLFRMIDAVRPTLLLDEADYQLKGENRSDLMAILNSGHRRSSATVARMEADEDGQWRQVEFSTFTGIAFSNIGKLPETLQDRSIGCWMRRATPTEKHEHLRDGRSEVLIECRKKFARWAADLKNLADVEMPEELANRLGDNWRTAFRIAAAAGGSWPARALAAARAGIANNGDGDNKLIALLDGIWTVLYEKGVVRMHSDKLVAGLLELDEGQWKHANNGFEIDAYYLRTLLSPVIPKTKAMEKLRRWREGNNNPKCGYHELHFEDAWMRYCGKGLPSQFREAADTAPDGADASSRADMPNTPEHDPAGAAPNGAAHEHEAGAADASDGPQAKAYPREAHAQRRQSDVRRTGQRRGQTEGRSFVMDAVSMPELRDDAAAILRKYRCRVKYATTDREAAAAIAAVIADAAGGLVGIDTETMPHESERRRLAELRQMQLAARGTLKAAERLRGQAGQAIDALGKARADVKNLAAQIRYAESAALDPHRASIRLLQAYGGGETVAVIDMARVGWAALAPLWEAPLVAHNAAFDVTFLYKAGVEPKELHCTMQASRLLHGPDVASLADAAATVLGIELDKTQQTSDWGAERLSIDQVHYAAMDAVVVWHLADRMLPRLAERAPAYEIQMTAIPAVARMQLRGFRLDTEAHARLMVDLAADRREAETAYLDACRECGRDDLAARGMPSTPAGKEALLNALLSSDELANWTRTAKAGRLSTKRSELRRAAHYGPIATLSRVAVLDKQLDSFGTTLAAHVSPVTGRIHASYNVAGTVSGRAACSRPNLQQIPKDGRFRQLFRAAARLRAGGRRLQFDGTARRGGKI